MTNDVASLAPGETRYAAYLTPQGRMITDMNVTASPDRLLVDVPASLAASLTERLDGLIFAEDAQVRDESSTLDVWTAIAPGDAGEMTDIVVAHGMPNGVDYPEIDFDTFEVVRIERGIPRFLVDMDHETIPLEAGIEDRAISFTKGCYVGQEVIVRVTHRGGGRVAKKLVRWKADDSAAVVPLPGSRIFSFDRDIGRVTSAVFSPGGTPWSASATSIATLSNVARKLRSCGMIPGPRWSLNDLETPRRVARVRAHCCSVVAVTL